MSTVAAVAGEDLICTYCIAEYEDVFLTVDHIALDTICDACGRMFTIARTVSGERRRSGWHRLAGTQLMARAIADG